MTLRNTLVYVGAFSALTLGSVGCATKKHVREAIAPVQNQVNQTDSKVSTLQKQTDENKQSIGDLDRQVATADEKAVDAGRKAAAASEAASRAQSAASEAAQRAEAANTAAMQAQHGASKDDKARRTLDNYKRVTPQHDSLGIGRCISHKDKGPRLGDVGR